MTTVLARFGRVCGWISNGSALLILIGAVAVAVLDHSAAQDGWQAAIFLVIVAALVWISGRAAKYIFAGT
jgi:hypothetical protein